MRVLLTGGTGMVGRNIIDHPMSEKFQVIAPPSNILNLLDSSAVENYIADVNPDVVIHAAGRVGGIQANMANPVEFLYENSMMGLNVIFASKKNKVKKLINLSSSCMYPRDAKNPLKESQVLQGELEPTNEGYALAKITAMRLCQYISRTDSDYKYISLIPCNLYGLYDKFEPHHSHMIPAVIRKLHEAKENKVDVVDIWGDGEARREFMFASDLADCIYRIIQGMGAGSDVPDVMNVGVGRDYSINEYYRVIADVVGYKGSFYNDISKPIGMRQKLIDSALINNFGWSSSTSLRDGIEITYRFFKGLK